MPGFLPFRALRYATDDLSAVVAPPYDVLSAAQVEDLHRSDPHNITHVDVPDGGDQRYMNAARVLAEWVADQVLVTDPTPTLTLYRLRFSDAAGAARDVVGVLGGLQVLDPAQPLDPDQAEVPPVLPHERTTPKASTDRLDLTRATRANLSPVWGLSLATGLTALLSEPGELVGRVLDELDPAHPVEHVVERITDPDRIAAICDHLASHPVLIADGHHRYGIARTYRDETRAASGRTDTPAEYTLAFVNELVADQLSVEAIHRLYHDVTADQLIERLGRSFTLVPTERPTPATLVQMASDGFLVLVAPDQTYRLVPDLVALADVRALDGLWLEETLGTDLDLTYQHGVADAVAAVDDGTAAAAILIRPVSVAEIERTARERVLMPPKSTFFTPKLKTGLVIRPLGD